MAALTRIREDVFLGEALESRPNPEHDRSIKRQVMSREMDFASNWPMGSAWRSIRTWAVPAIVLTAWFVGTVAAICFVYRFSANLPYMDEWADLPVFVGEAPLTSEFLWRQHNDSRMPLRRLATFALLRLGGGDFRIVNYGAVGLLSAYCFVLLLMLRYFRGSTALTDALVPIVLLQWSMYIHFVWSDPGLHWGMFVAALAIPTLLAVHRADRSTAGALTLAACSATATLSCFAGLPIGAAIGVWLIVTGLVAWRCSFESRRHALLSISLGIACLALIAVYFIGHRRGTPFEDASWLAIIDGIVELAACALRPNLAPLGTPIGIAVLLVSGCAVTASAFQWGKTNRSLAAFAAVFFPGSILALAAIASWRRAGYGPGSLTAERYTLMSACLILVPYLAVATSPRLGSLVGMAYLALTLATLPANAVDAERAVRERFRDMKQLAAAIEYGDDSLEDLANKHYPGVFPSPEFLAERLHLIARNRFGVFRNVADWKIASLTKGCADVDRTFEEVSVALTPIYCHSARWRDGVGDGVGSDPYLVFALDRERFVRTIRIRLNVTGERDTCLLQAYWRNDKQVFAENERGLAVRIGSGDATTLVLPVNRTINQFRIDPDVGPCRFEIHAILVEEESDDSMHRTSPFRRPARK
jgi:hypothetical protein